MGNHPSVVSVNSECKWVPSNLVTKQVENIDSFKVDREAEETLFQNLSKRIQRIDGVKYCDIDCPSRRFFGPRTINVNIIPETNNYASDFRAVSSPSSGALMSLSYLSPPIEFETGAVFPSFSEFKLFLKMRFPLIKFIDLDRRFPVSHASFGAYVSNISKFDEKLNTYCFKAAFSPSNENYKAAVFAYLREKLEPVDFQPFNDYVAFGFSGRHCLSRDSSLVKDGSEPDLKLNIHQRGKAYCVFTDDDSLIPALKYEFNAAGKVPPNIVLRATAGTLLSHREMPLSEKFSIGGGSTMRSIQPHKFSLSYDNHKVGCEHYLTGGCDIKFPIIKERKVDLILFGNAGVGLKLHKSLIGDQLYDNAPSVFHVVSVGCGITASSKKVNFESTLSLPLSASYGIETVQYQINLTKNDLN